MGKTFDALNGNLERFILRQPMFFAATAPSGSDGHVNVSPKGMAGSLAVLDRSTVAYLDLTGSGIETVAHIRDNGRITLMFCAFDGAPMIVRLFGRGEILMPDDGKFADLRTRFPADHDAVRSIIVIHVYEVRTSCGYGVPLMEFQGDRDNFVGWADRKGGPEGVRQYWTDRNSESLDGLPGI